MVIPTFQLVESSISSSSSSSSSDLNPKDLILYQLKAHSDSVTAFSTGIGLCDSRLVSSSIDSTCKFWNLLDGTLLRTVTFPCALYGVAIDSSDSHFFAAGSDGSVYKGSMKANSRKTLSEAQDLVKWSQSHVGSIVSVVLVNEGRNLVSAGEDGGVWMWEVETEEVTMVIGNNNKRAMEGSVSDMIVASGTEYGGRGRSSAEGGRNNSFSSRLLNEEVISSMKKVMELGDVLTVVEQDKKRAINMLESSIAIYERLLELILEEALKGTSDSGEEEEEDEEGGRGGEEKDDK